MGHLGHLGHASGGRSGSAQALGHLGHDLDGDNVTQQPRGRALGAWVVMGHLGQIVTLLKSLDPLCHLCDTMRREAGNAGRMRGVAAKACIPIQYIFSLFTDS